MIELKTKCEECMHRNVCKNNCIAESYRNMLVNTTFKNAINGNMDNLNESLESYGIDLIVSCKHFRHDRVERKLISSFYH